MTEGIVLSHGKAPTTAAKLVSALHQQPDSVFFYESKGFCSDHCGNQILSKKTEPKPWSQDWCLTSCKEDATCLAFEYDKSGYCSLHRSQLVSRGNRESSYVMCFRKDTTTVHTFACP